MTSKGVEEIKLRRESGIRTGRVMNARMEVLDLVLYAVEMGRGEEGTLWEYNVNSREDKKKEEQDSGKSVRRLLPQFRKEKIMTLVA